jgi:putative sporulation protein YtaF
MAEVEGVGKVDLAALWLLAAALSLDSLSVGLLYGVRGIRLSWAAAGIVSLASGLLLAGAMIGGGLLRTILAPGVAGRLGALLLIGVGLWIAWSTLRGPKAAPGAGAAERAGGPPTGDLPGAVRRVWRLQLGRVGVVVEILREPGRADLDRSGSISLGEAGLLGIALALDSVAAGLGAAMAGMPLLGLPVAATLLSFFFLLAGCWGAGRLPLRLNGRWGALHGLVLVLLGLVRLVR